MWITTLSAESASGCVHLCAITHFNLLSISVGMQSRIRLPYQYFTLFCVWVTLLCFRGWAPSHAWGFEQCSPKATTLATNLSSWDRKNMEPLLPGDASRRSARSEQSCAT